MANTERSLSELLQAAQHMTNKADICASKENLSSPSVISFKNRTTVGEDLPKVDRSLAQLVQVGESLWPSHSSGDAGKVSTDHEAHASILLGSRGLDLPHMSSRLASLSTTVPSSTDAALPSTTAPPTAAPLDSSTSMSSFLRQHRQTAIVSALHESNQQTGVEVERCYWQQQRSKWEQDKQSLLSAFTHTGSDMLLSMTLPTPATQESLSNTSLFIKPGSGSDVSGGLSAEELSFSRALMDYNKQVLCNGTKPELSNVMFTLAQGMQQQGVSELWRVVARMARVSESLDSCEGRTGSHRTSARVTASIVSAATSLLQEKYMEHMEAMVSHDLSRAQRGGVPGMLSLVKGYLGVTLPRSLLTELEDGEGVGGAPVWPLIFYCLRTGAVKEASQAAVNNNCPSVVEMIGALEQCSRSPEGRVSPEMEKRLRLSYKRAVKTMRDPYKRAVYCILARCHVAEDHPDIITTTDDYLWLKLMLVSTGSSSSAEASTSSSIPAKQDVLTLQQLQAMLYKQYGEAHFNAHDQPLLYTTVLLLTGQFEAAVEFLRRSDKYLCHAVHVAITLYTSRVLCVPQNISAPLLSREADDSETCERVNIARLILHYTRRFDATHPLEALHYCFLLRSLKTATGEDVFLNCISDLALSSREFDLILGRLNEDGIRTPGIIDGFNVDVEDVTQMVALSSERKGLHEDAIRLYDLAKNHEKVISLLNKLLAQVVHLPSSSSSSVITSSGDVSGATNSAGSQRERVLELACNIGLRYRNHGHSASHRTASTMHLLLDLATVFDLYHAGRYQEVIDVLSRLELIALKRDEVEYRVSSIASIASEVKDVLPSVLLAAITATHHIYNTSTDTPINTKHLQEQARAIVTFAGMIPLRLHADVNARLVQLEALIN